MLACAGDNREGLDGPNTPEATVYRAAASGDHDAQVEMANRILAKGAANLIGMPDATLMALQWANMAATSGKARHALAYAGALMVQASDAIQCGMPESSCEDIFAEALAIIDKVASAGHGRAELVSLSLASHMTAQGIAKAQEIGRSILIDPLTEAERSEDDTGMAWLAAVLGQQFGEDK